MCACAGGRFSISGKLVVFSNISPVIVMCGVGVACEAPSSLTAAVLYKSVRNQEHLEFHLGKTGRVSEDICFVSHACVERVLYFLP